MVLDASCGKCGTWKELPISTSSLDAQVIIHCGIVKLLLRQKAQAQSTEDLYIMAVHEFGENREYLPPRTDSECWKHMNVL